jgi:hypothetical protein
VEGAVALREGAQVRENLGYDAALGNTRSFDAADAPSVDQLIGWLFVFNSRFARLNQASCCQPFGLRNQAFARRLPAKLGRHLAPRAA